MDPTVLDTEAFAPLPRSQWQQAARSRAGVQIVPTPGALVRLRDTGAASRTAPTVVLLTDAPHTLECYDDLVAELGPQVRTIIVEPPGFGFSWVTDPAAFTYPGSTEAVLAALGQLGITGAVLGGACVYGYLALAVARAEPSLASGVLLAQTPSWQAARRWGHDVLDPHGQLATPWEGQARWRLGRESAAEGWYRFAAGPNAPLQRWQHHARHTLQTGATYALASQSQRWWDEDTAGPEPVDLPATVLWGEADRSHHKAGTDPDSVLELLPQGHVVRLSSVGHFADTEDVDVTAEHIRRLLHL